MLSYARRLFTRAEKALQSYIRHLWKHLSSDKTINRALCYIFRILLLKWAVRLWVPGTADNIMHPNKTGWDLKATSDFTLSRNARIILPIPPFPEEIMRVIYWRLILTLKTELIHLLLSGHASLRSKKTTVCSNPEWAHILRSIMGILGQVLPDSELFPLWATNELHGEVITLMHMHYQ